MAQTTTEVVEKTEVKPAEAAAKPKRVVKRRSSKRQETSIVVKSKRKTAVARAYAKGGKGNIRINGKDIDSLEFAAAKDLMLEPVAISDMARQQLTKLDIKIIVYGGGVSSQIQAVRGAIAKALVESSKSEMLKKEFLNYDRSFLVDDQRRVEPKKFKGPKARARFQTSYR
jgi:ribosomal protein S9